MSLKAQLSGDLKQAMLAGDDLRKSTLRMLIAAIGVVEVAGSTRRELTDAEVMQVLAKQVKQRRESIEEFKKGGRQDLVDREAAEMEVLEAYLPAQMGREEIEVEAKKVVAETGASGPSDKGKVMKELMTRLAGQADGRDVNDVVTSILAGS
ncbi:MAG: GatB/YqeY domain-containing protein [Dehalococcoidia bacterium]